MLRRTVPTRRAGDFIASIPSDAVGRAVFLLNQPSLASSSSSVVSTSSSSSSSQKKAAATPEALARQLMSHFHSTARKSITLNSTGAALSVKNNLLTSPLSKISGVKLPSCSENNNEVALVLSDCVDEDSHRAFAWIGQQEDTKNNNNGNNKNKKILALTKESPTSNRISLQNAELVVNSFASSNSRCILKLLNNKPTSTKTGAEEGGGGGGGDHDDGSGPKKEVKEEIEEGIKRKVQYERKTLPQVASPLLQAQLRLDHAAVAYATLKRLCRDCVESGRDTKFRSNRMTDCTIFENRVGAIAAAEHVLLSATQYTCLSIAESLFEHMPAITAAASSSSSSSSDSSSSSSTISEAERLLVSDLEYDSGLLFLLSRSLLDSSHRSAERLFLHHGPLTETSNSFRGSAYKWFHGDLLSGFTSGLGPVSNICSHLGKQVDSVEINRKQILASAGAGSSSSNPFAALTQSVSSLIGNSASKNDSARNLTDVHLNLTSRSQSLIKDFSKLKQIIAKESTSGNNSSSNKNSSSTSSSSTTTTTCLSNSFLAPLVMPIAAELLGSTSILYQATHVLEFAESSTLAEQGEEEMKEQLKKVRENKTLEQVAKLLSEPPVFANVTEAAAVSWLALEVAHDQSKAKRAKLFQDIVAVSSSSSSCYMPNDKTALLLEENSTHPMELPKNEAAEKERKRKEEEQKAEDEG